MIIAKRSFTELPSFLDQPAMAAPPGTHHNFLNPSNHQTLFRSIITFCLVLSVLAVGTRMWTKTRVIRKVVLEDCTWFKFIMLRLFRIFLTYLCRDLLFSAGMLRSLIWTPNLKPTGLVRSFWRGVLILGEKFQIRSSSMESSSQRCFTRALRMRSLQCVCNEAEIM